MIVYVNAHCQDEYLLYLAMNFKGQANGLLGKRKENDLNRSNVNRLRFVECLYM